MLIRMLFRTMVNNGDRYFALLRVVGLLRGCASKPNHANRNTKQKAPLLPKEGWQRLPLTGWFSPLVSEYSTQASCCLVRLACFVVVPSKPNHETHEIHE